MMRLSACYIVKNEADNLPKSLDSLREAVDEIIVVDTGSTDQTKEIAVAYGAQVYDFLWQHDFSAPRNFALEQAAGEWIIFLDADEYFAPKAQAELRAIVARFHGNRTIDGIACRLLNIDQDKNNQFIDETCQVRLFRNKKTLRYYGQIHEGLKDTAVRKHTFELVQTLLIYHTGYSSSMIQQKLQRNLLLLQQKQGESKENLLYFVDCYFGLGEYEKAEEYARRTIASGIRYIGNETKPYDRFIRVMIQLQRPVETICQTADEAMKVYPQAAEFPLLKGIVLWGARKYLQATQCFIAGEKLKNRSLQVRALCLSDNAANLWPIVYRYLGEFEQMQFHEQQALEYFLTGLQYYPYDLPLFQAVYAYLKHREPVEAIQFLNQLYDKEKDAAFLAEALRANGAGAVYLYYAKRSGQAEDVVTTYMAAGRYDAAAIAAADELDTLYRLAIAEARRQHRTLAGSALWALLPEKYRKLSQEAGQ